jgi:hypothetical protein
MIDISIPDYGVPLPPERFVGREELVDRIGQRLRQSEFLSSQVVGSPQSGKTSLLRYLASHHCAGLLGDARLVRPYIDAAALGQQAKPAAFWIKVFRELRGKLVRNEDLDLIATLDNAVHAAKQGTLDIFDLEDVFDAFSRAAMPVALLIDEFNVVVGNSNFQPPDDFFNEIRSLSQRTPRGVAFVVTVHRPLSDVVAATAGPSPFYNHFGNFPLLALSEEEIRLLVKAREAGNAGILPEKVVRLVIDASYGHPYLANYLIRLAQIEAAAGRQLEAERVLAEIKDADGPFVRVSRQNLDALSATERQAVDAHNRGTTTSSQQRVLERLAKYGLLPPGLSP